MSRSPITNDADRLRNEHAGEMLVSAFLEPLGLAVGELGSRVGVSAGRLEEVVAGRSRISAEIDLRLVRYFGLSEGFFLRLQDSYELLEAKRLGRRAGPDRAPRRLSAPPSTARP